MCGRDGDSEQQSTEEKQVFVKDIRVVSLDITLALKSEKNPQNKIIVKTFSDGKMNTRITLH